MNRAREESRIELNARQGEKLTLITQPFPAIRAAAAAESTLWKG